MKNIFLILTVNLIFAFKAYGSSFDIQSKTQEELDERVAQYAVEGYEKVNQNWTMPEEGTGLSVYKTESPHWRACSGFLSEIVDYERQLGVLPSVALVDFLDAKTVADCRISMYAVMTYVLLRVLGEEEFNTLITEHEATHHFLISSASTPLLKFTELSHQRYLWEKNTIGLFGYIHNVAHYRIRHVHGAYPGENVVISSLDDKGDPLYLGFPFSKPLNRIEIRDRLKKALMEEPLKTERKTTKIIDSERQKIFERMLKSLDEAYEKKLSVVIDNFEFLFGVRQHVESQQRYFSNREAVSRELREVVGAQGEKLFYQFKLEKLEAFLEDTAE